MSASGGASRKGEGAGRRLAHKGTSRRHPGGKRTGGGSARRSNATDARPRIDLISPHSSCPHPSRRMDRSSRPDWSRARCAHPSTRRLVYPAALVQKWRVSPRPGVARSHDPRARRRSNRDAVASTNAKCSLFERRRPRSAFGRRARAALRCCVRPVAAVEKSGRRRADEEYIRFGCLWSPVTDLTAPRYGGGNISDSRDLRPMGIGAQCSAAKNPQRRQFFQQRIRLFSSGFSFVTAN